MDWESGDIQAMTTENEKAILGIMSRIMKEYGFRKKRSSWYRENEEVIMVVNLQHSSWGNHFYLNVGVLIKALSDLKDPPEYKCHIRDRIEENGPDMRRALDASDDSITPEDREQIIADKVRNIVMPTLNSWSFKESLIELYRQGFGNTWVLRIALDFLQQESGRMSAQTNP